MTSRGRRLSTASVVGLTMLLAAAYGLAIGPENAVHAGQNHTDETVRVPRVPGNGYDGVNYYRMAIDPWSADEYSAGVRFDLAAYRQQRIGYPVVARVVAGGRPELVPLALVAVNVAALGALALGAATAAVRGGLHPAWGLALLAWPGWIVSVRYSVAEPLAAALMLWALLFAIRGRDGPAAMLLGGAVLTRETLVVTVLVVGLVRFRAAGSSAGWYLVPLTVFAAWQATVALRWGQVGTVSLTDGGHALGPPLAGIVVRATHGGMQIGWFVAFAVLAGLVVYGLARVELGSLARDVTAAVLAAEVLVLSIAPAAMWNFPRHFLRTSFAVVVAVFLHRVIGPAARARLGQEGVQRPTGSRRMQSWVGRMPLRPSR